MVHGAERTCEEAATCRGRFGGAARPARPKTPAGRAGPRPRPGPEMESFPRSSPSGALADLGRGDQASAQSGRNYCVMTERGKETWEAFQATVGPAQKWDSRLVLGPEPQVAAEAIRRALGLAV
ncbi:unnamed protein product [Durusdinium trenchii]|uniref:Uncharacterized protein n=1 Tax=Durusdinium trenchii TaxID=1381693 RepID=A0ABP0RIR8_9DINO